MTDSKKPTPAVDYRLRREVQSALRSRQIGALIAVGGLVESLRLRGLNYAQIREVAGLEPNEFESLMAELDELGHED